LEYILETRIVQTELFAIYLYYPGKWLIFRRIVPNNEIKYLKIHKEKMLKYYFEKLENKDKASIKTEECFSLNKQALDKKGNYFLMQKLFNLTKNQLILSDKWQKKLGEKIIYYTIGL